MFLLVGPRGGGGTFLAIVHKSVIFLFNLSCAKSKETKAKRYKSVKLTPYGPTVKLYNGVILILVGVGGLLLHWV